MLAPKKTKHRKWQKGRAKGKATSGTDINFGKYALKALGTSWITSRQIEASRRVITRKLARGGKMWIRIFPDKPVTSKSSEVPMGKGKGAVEHYVAVVKSGRILFELDGVPEKEAVEALKLAAYKLPIKTKVIIKETRL